MNEQLIQQLKDSLKEFIAQILQSGQPIDAQLETMIAQAMEHVATRIQQLRSESANQSPADGLPPGQAGETPQMQEAMPSSNIHQVAYDDKTGRLMVQFLGDYPNKQGATYAYEGVPKNIFELFRKGAVPARTDGKNAWGRWWKGKSPSIGSSMYTLIKNGGYSYKKIA